MNLKRVVCLFFGVLPFFSALANPLEDYVKKPDASYSWELKKKIEREDCSIFIVRLHSQTWRTDLEVNSPLWQHWLTIVHPKQVLTNQSLLFIANGDSKEKVPEQADPKWIKIAKNTKSVVSEIRNVPNQPLIYLKDGKERYEDDSVAYSWDKVMITGDQFWNIRLPMVKSVIRAMDTVQSVINTLPQKGKKIDEFVLSGISKRGWTTWLTAVVDKRVISIIPMVIDVLNVQKSLKHHYSVYGFWAPAIKDYEHHQILSRYETKQFSELMKVDDPYIYKDQLTLPKYIIHATGDQFFLPDSSRFYFKDLRGPSYLLSLPNTDHSLKESDAFEQMESFYAFILSRKPFPRFSWAKKKEGSDVSIEVKTIDKPQRVKLWSAMNGDKRDFQLKTIGKAFTSVDLTDSGQGIYLGKVKKPSKGFLAFFIELTYPGVLASPLKFTTEVNVIPDSFPLTQ